MPSARAAIGAANAGASRAPEPIALPVDPGGPTERLALENLLRRARSSGLAGARLFGHVAAAPLHGGDIAHACAALVAFAAAAAGLDAGLWLLVVIALSSALRAIGAPSLDVLLPKRPCWSLVLRPCTPATRRIVVASTDRARLAPRLPLCAFGMIGVALLSLAAGRPGWFVGAASLLGVVAVAAWLCRSARPEPEGPEATAALSLIRLAAREDPTTAVVLAACSSARGGGVLDVLDWWGLRPDRVEVHLVRVPSDPGAGGAPAPIPAAASALLRAGWRVRCFPPDGVPVVLPDADASPAVSTPPSSGGLPEALADSPRRSP